MPSVTAQKEIVTLGARVFSVRSFRSTCSVTKLAWERSQIWRIFNEEDIGGLKHSGKAMLSRAFAVLAVVIRRH